MDEENGIKRIGSTDESAENSLRRLVASHAVNVRAGSGGRTKGKAIR
jgi:hypothetical protein